MVHNLFEITTFGKTYSQTKIQNFISQKIKNDLQIDFPFANQNTKSFSLKDGLYTKNLLSLGL